MVDFPASYVSLPEGKFREVLHSDPFFPNLNAGHLGSPHQNAGHLLLLNVRYLRSAVKILVSTVSNVRGNFKTILRITIQIYTIYLPVVKHILLLPSLKLT